jgi:hypothetical protein
VVYERSKDVVLTPPYSACHCPCRYRRPHRRGRVRHCSSCDGQLQLCRSVIVVVVVAVIVAADITEAIVTQAVTVSLRRYHHQRFTLLSFAWTQACEHSHALQYYTSSPHKTH